MERESAPRHPIGGTLNSEGSCREDWMFPRSAGALEVWQTAVESDQLLPFLHLARPNHDRIGLDHLDQKRLRGGRQGSTGILPFFWMTSLRRKSEVCGGVKPQETNPAISRRSLWLVPEEISKNPLLTTLPVAVKAHRSRQPKKGGPRSVTSPVCRSNADESHESLSQRHRRFYIHSESLTSGCWKARGLCG